jgi:hypothetical protein
MKNKYSFYAAFVLRPFAAVIALIRVAYDKYVPIGYEDENGFHLGLPVASKRLRGE